MLSALERFVDFLRSSHLSGKLVWNRGVLPSWWLDSSRAAVLP
jgi:hypothetical protein